VTRELAPAVIGVSLKMYFDHATTLEWAADVARIAARHEAVTSGAVQLVVLPSFTALVPVVEAVSATAVSVGAQDLFWDDRGAFTGEVSGADLAEIGCSFVEVGHAERRRIFGETDEVVAAKVAAAVRNGLTPLLCVGEEIQTDAALAASACIEQLESALSGVEGDPGDASVVVAYEPVWAIGAESAAGPEHIAEVCGLLSEWMLRHPLVATSRVIYGGSAGPGLLAQLGSTVDGLFLGRFAHDPANLELVLDEALELHRRAR
jgi:triosephosphate isomerase